MEAGLPTTPFPPCRGAARADRRRRGREAAAPWMHANHQSVGARLVKALIFDVESQQIPFRIFWGQIAQIVSWRRLR